MERIKNAIIIHGPGRSGTTLLSSILSLHEELGWISGYVNRYPKFTFLSLFNRLQSISWFEKWNRGMRRFPRPSEAYKFWMYYIPEFDDPAEINIDSSKAEKTINAINQIMQYTSKNRFITKITGNSRIKSIDALFNDPLIIWIDRDPKAVIMSYYKLRWRYRNDLERFSNTPKKELLKEYVAFYNNFQEEKNHLKKYRMINLKYEDLVTNRQHVFKEICEFSNLPYSRRFESVIESWDIKKGSNLAYKKYLNRDEEEYLNNLLAN